VNRHETDVLIVGGGFSGLLIGELLADAGVRCSVLEAGPAVRADAGLRTAVTVHQHPDPGRWDCRLDGVGHVAATLPAARMRVRAVGGRSLVWGGWCTRLDQDALVDADEVGAPWPVGIDTLRPLYQQVERLLTVRSARRGLPGLATAIGRRVFAPRIARDGDRVRTALSLRRGRRRVVSECVVRRVLYRDGAVRGVEYWDRAGRVDAAYAPVVVLCASPVESARILLTEPPAPLAQQAALVGQGLVDHLLVSYLAVAPVPARRARGTAGTAAFIPPVARTGNRRRPDYLGGFSLEVHGPLDPTRVDANWLPMLQLDAHQARQASVYVVTAMGDALPDRRRFVDLHPTATDTLGRPVPVVHQVTTGNDRRMIADMKATALAVIDAATPPGSTIYQFRDPLRHRALFHEAGGCRMGLDPRTSVTDPWGAVRGTRGLFVADASVMPTGGDRHPTLTILALAARTAARITRASRAGLE
jgi:choline dehydrogenase-like flavoprotein